VPVSRGRIREEILRGLAESPEVSRLKRYIQKKLAEQEKKLKLLEQKF